jgi:spermidine/putrescine transport system ATP-binding protein
MSLGFVEQIGAPEDIYHHPSTVFVAGFIGSANLFRTQVGPRDGEHVAVDIAGRKVPVPATARDSLGEGMPATVMVRPERVHVLMQEPVNGVVGVPCTVADLVFQGPVVRVALATDDGQEVVAHVGATEQLPLLRPGDHVWAGWDRSAARLLPEPSSGQDPNADPAET